MGVRKWKSQIEFGALRNATLEPKRGQGRKANQTGKTQEAMIRATLESHGYTCHKPGQNRPTCTNIYGEPHFADLEVEPSPSLPKGLIIESKWQQATGSVDEKFPYLVENIMHRYPAPCIIVLDGNGYRSGAAAWLRRQVDGKSLLGVFTLNEFVKWCNNTL